VAGDKLLNQDFLIQNGVEAGKQKLTKTIKETQSSLQKKVMALEETGPTALGPALASSIAMAGEGAPGSMVIICTDGLSNVGLGAFDEVKTDAEYEKVEAFYLQLGEYAKSKGVMVSIVSIIGEECNIDTLSKISELTGGDV